MAPDLSEKLLGIDIGDTQDRNRQRDDDDPEEREQFVFFEAGGHRLALPVGDVRTLAEVPDEFTRVPRSPAAIEGMVDLRGEITAVIDPRVHFPDGDGTADGPGDERSAAERSTFADEERLLVLDRPADQQSAALRADEVLGVETIPESAILDEAAVEDRMLTGEALAHPLVAALIERERTPEGASVVASAAAVDVAPEVGGDAGSVAAVTSAESTRSGADTVGSPFELEETEAGAETANESASDGRPKSEPTPPREIVVEVTPLIDLDTLLLASGQRE